MAPKYKLTYFDITGLAESHRFLLSYGNLEFDDVRFARDSSWPTVKATINLPLGQLPILEFDGNVLHQSTAIARYLGNVIGIVGNTPVENAKIDAIADTLVDLRIKIFDWYREEDETKKQTKRDELVKETFPYYLTKLDSLAQQNGGYLAINKLTWADVVFAANIDFLDEFVPEVIGTPSVVTGYSNLEALVEEVRNNPGVKAWLDRRPPSKFV